MILELLPAGTSVPTSVVGLTNLLIAVALCLVVAKAGTLLIAGVSGFFHNRKKRRF